MTDGRKKVNFSQFYYPFCIEGKRNILNFHHKCYKIARIVMRIIIEIPFLHRIALSLFSRYNFKFQHLLQQFFIYLLKTIFFHLVLHSIFDAGYAIYIIIIFILWLTCSENNSFNTNESLVFLWTFYFYRFKKKCRGKLEHL